MNPCYYHIERFTYKPKGKDRTISEQRKYFIKMVQNFVEANPGKYPSWFLNAVVSRDPDKGGYWNTVPDNGNKTQYFMLSKRDREKWSTGGRLSYQKRVIFKNDPRWKSTETQIEYTKPKQALGYESDYVPPIPDYAKHAERVKGEVRKGSIGELIRKQVKR
jgi:hypothetical protein